MYIEISYYPERQRNTTENTETLQYILERFCVFILQKADSYLVNSFSIRA